MKLLKIIYDKDAARYWLYYAYNGKRYRLPTMQLTEEEKHWAMDAAKAETLYFIQWSR